MGFANTANFCFTRLLVVINWRGERSYGETMGAYAYEAPSNLSDAIALLDDHAKEGKRAQILAGGTDLLVQMRSVDNAPRTIIDVKSLEETNRLDIGDEIYIGSAIPSAQLYENEELKNLLPGLIEASDLIGSTQTLTLSSLNPPTRILPTFLTLENVSTKYLSA